MNKKVAIIMINYKDYAEKFLHDSYNSLIKIDYPRSLYRIYIVDNESSEETRRKIKEFAPGAEVVPTEGNGWGYANNLGAERGIKEGFDDYFLFVNMDTIFHPDFVKEAVEAAESDKEIGIVQSKILLYPAVNGKYKLNSKGNALTFLGFGYCAGDDKQDDTRDAIQNIAVASGVGLLISKNIFLKIGKCDASYFMYHDDVELSFKTKLLGMRVVLAPKSVIYHKHEFSRSIKMVSYMERNRFRFLLEFYKWKTLILIFPAWLFMEIGMIPYEILNKWFWTKLKVYGYFLKPRNMAKVLAKRRQVQALRKIKDKKLLKGVVGVVKFQQIENFVLKCIANPIFKIYWKIAKSLIVW